MAVLLRSTPWAIVCVTAESFEEAFAPVALDLDADVLLVPGIVVAPMEDLEAVWQALVLGLRDYINKNGFRVSCWACQAGSILR